MNYKNPHHLSDATEISSSSDSSMISPQGAAYFCIWSPINSPLSIAQALQLQYKQHIIYSFW